MPALGQDRTIIKQVEQRLTTRGLAPCKLNVQSKNGEVTLTGNIHFPHQRTAAMNAASTADGVRSVVDRMSVKAAVKRT
jgi:osmotically-inducible protein OsmY